MRNHLLKIIIWVLIWVLAMNVTTAWVWLFAQLGDVITNTKWNEMVSELNTKIKQLDIIGWSWITVTPSGSGVVISADWIAGNPIPYILNDYNFRMQPSSTSTLSLVGTNFTPTSTVSIPSWAGTINSTTVNSPTSIDINVTSGVTETTYDIVVDNAGIDNTAWTGNGVDMIEVITSTWVDLRAGWDTFTNGNAAGNDIRHRADMTMVRDANGMYFNWSNPWSSWVKFESLAWTRGTNQTLDWIFTTPTAAMMKWYSMRCMKPSELYPYILMYFMNV